MRPWKPSRRLAPGLRRFHDDRSGALQAIEFLLVLTFGVLPMIYLILSILRPALVEYEAMTMTILASPFF